MDGIGRVIRLKTKAEAHACYQVEMLATQTSDLL